MADQTKPTPTELRARYDKCVYDLLNDLMWAVVNTPYCDRDQRERMFKLEKDTRNALDQMLDTPSVVSEVCTPPEATIDNGKDLPSGLLGIVDTISELVKCLSSQPFDVDYVVSVVRSRLIVELKGWHGKLEPQDVPAQIVTTASPEQERPIVPNPTPDETNQQEDMDSDASQPCGPASTVTGDVVISPLEKVVRGIVELYNALEAGGDLAHIYDLRSSLDGAVEALTTSECVAAKMIFDVLDNTPPNTGQTPSDTKDDDAPIGWKIINIHGNTVLCQNHYGLRRRYLLSSEDVDTKEDMDTNKYVDRIRSLELANFSMMAAAMKGRQVLREIDRRCHELQKTGQLHCDKDSNLSRLSCPVAAAAIVKEIRDLIPLTFTESDRN